DRLRDHDPDRQVAVVRAAGRVEGAVARPEPDLALDDGTQLALELLALDADLADRPRPVRALLLRGDAQVGHGRFNSRPWPGRVRSGRRTPPIGSGTPSKSSRSTRT